MKVGGGRVWKGSDSGWDRDWVSGEYEGKPLCARFRSEDWGWRTRGGVRKWLHQTLRAFTARTVGGF